MRPTEWAARRMLQEARRSLTAFHQFTGEPRRLRLWERVADRIGILDRLIRCGWAEPRYKPDPIPRDNAYDTIVFRRARPFEPTRPWVGDDNVDGRV